MKALKLVCLRLWLPLLALLGGCSTWFEPGMGAQLDYGIPSPPHDPTVEMVDFSYTPASPIHVGDALSFTLKLNHPLAVFHTARLFVQIDNPPGDSLWLHDDGQAPDETARDGVYSDSLIWTLEPVADAPVTAYLAWDDGTPGQQLSAPPLTILAAEEGQ